MTISLFQLSSNLLLNINLELLRNHTKNLCLLFRNLDLDFWLHYLEISMGFLNILRFLISLQIKFFNNVYILKKLNKNNKYLKVINNIGIIDY